MALLPGLLRIFYETGLTYLPVLAANSNGKEHKPLVGFLSRPLLDCWMADLERVNRHYEELPRQLLISETLSEDVLKAIGSEQTIGSKQATGSKRRIPALNLKGEQEEVWDLTTLLGAVSAFQQEREQERESSLSTAFAEFSSSEDTSSTYYPSALPSSNLSESSLPASATEPAGRALSSPDASPTAWRPSAQASHLSAGEGEFFSADNGRQWLTGLILEAIPWPLFAADRQGRTLFYNEQFVDQILSRTFFKKSIRLVENYLLKLAGNLLSDPSHGEQRSAERHPAFGAWLSQLSLSVRVIPMGAGAAHSGYLYIFQQGEDPAFEAEVSSRLAGGGQLGQIMDEIEAGIIDKVLARQANNISQAAETLGVKRSTLQNKIKRLRSDRTELAARRQSWKDRGGKEQAGSRKDVVLNMGAVSQTKTVKRIAGGAKTGKRITGGAKTGKRITGGAKTVKRITGEAKTVKRVAGGAKTGKRITGGAKTGKEDRTVKKGRAKIERGSAGRTKKTDKTKTVRKGRLKRISAR